MGLANMKMRAELFGLFTDKMQNFPFICYVLVIVSVSSLSPNYYSRTCLTYAMLSQLRFGVDFQHFIPDNKLKF